MDYSTTIIQDQENGIWISFMIGEDGHAFPSLAEAMIATSIFITDEEDMVDVDVTIIATPSVSQLNHAREINIS